MISALLVKEPRHRLPLRKLLEHPWIVENASPNGIPDDLNLQPNKNGAPAAE